MDERVRFVARLLDGEGMSGLCRELGVSRMTGYKIYDHYRSQGLEAFTDARGGRCDMPTSCRRKSKA